MAGKNRITRCNRLHVITWRGGWRIIREGQHRALTTTTDRSSAILAAIAIAEKRKIGSVIVHKPDARVDITITLSDYHYDRPATSATDPGAV